MKLTKTILSGLLFSISFFGETHAQCDNSAISYIAANNIKAAVLNGGDLFWDRNNGQFIVPYSLGASEVTTTFFSNGLWMGGFDSNGILKIAMQTYGNASGQTDYWAGPIDASTGGPFENGCNDFDRIWKVHRNDILQIKEDFNDNGVIDSPLPISIKKWPARGNPFFEQSVGYALPDQDLAPFYDNNNDGLFNPMNGDRPAIDPTLPDVVPNEMAWCVFNDIQGTHGQTNGLPIGVEVQLLVYAFNCSENSFLNYTIFTRHKVINKSQSEMSGFRIGFFNDMDLGCYIDDYIGCDTILNTHYFYNKDNNDGEPQCNSADTFGLNPPVQAVTFLNHSLSNFSYNNPNVNGSYAFFGQWGNGASITYGGTGYNPNSTDYVNHVFPDNPNDPTGWSMVTEADKFPMTDRRSVGSAGPFSFPINGQIVLDVAYSYHREPGADHLENINVALATIPDLQNFYDSKFSGGCMQVVAQKETLNDTLPFSIFPNPNNGNFDVLFDKTTTASQISLFDFSGKIILTESVPAYSERHTIDLSGDLPSGIYFVKWALEDGQFATKKIIVN